MSVKVTLTVEIGSGATRSLHITEARTSGDNERFAADDTVVNTLRALSKALDRMPARQHELKDGVHDGKRVWPPVITSRREATPDAR